MDAGSVEGKRLRQLDSIRGLASLSVVLLHFHEVWIPDDPARLSKWQHTVLIALRPIYSGSEAVILFFLLSGLVLSLPYLRGKEQAYPQYLRRRVVRVYGPYLAALPLGVAGEAIWQHHAYHGLWASGTWSRPVSTELIVQHLLFLGVYDWHQFDFVIWSLIQEMRVSIIFPILFFVVVRIGGWASIFSGFALSGAALLLVPDSPDLSPNYSLGITIHYISFFMLGTAFAAKLGSVENWWQKTGTRTHYLLGAVGLAAYSFDGSVATRVLRMLRHGDLPAVNTQLIFANWIAAFGALALICSSLHAAKLRRLLIKPFALLLGRISYSLYLIHPFVLLTLTFACGEKVPMWAQFPIYLGGSLLLGWLFCIWVEEPFIRLSRAL